MHAHQTFRKCKRFKHLESHFASSAKGLSHWSKAVTLVIGMTIGLDSCYNSSQSDDESGAVAEAMMNESMIKPSLVAELGKGVDERVAAVGEGSAIVRGGVREKSFSAWPLAVPQGSPW